MTAIASHLSTAELETRYKTAADPVAKSHFHTIWLLSKDYTAQEVAEILAFCSGCFLKRCRCKSCGFFPQIRLGPDHGPAEILSPVITASLPSPAYTSSQGNAYGLSLRRLYYLDPIAANRPSDGRSFFTAKEPNKLDFNGGEHGLAEPLHREICACKVRSASGDRSRCSGAKRAICFGCFPRKDDRDLPEPTEADCRLCV